MNKLPKEFEKLLVEWRAELNLTQKELADELQVTQKTISMWENGVFKASRVKEFQVLEWAFERGLIDKSPKTNWKEES